MFYVSTFRASSIQQQTLEKSNIGTAKAKKQKQDYHENRDILKQETIHTGQAVMSASQGRTPRVHHSQDKTFGIETQIR